MGTDGEEEGRRGRKGKDGHRDGGQVERETTERWEKKVRIGQKQNKKRRRSVEKGGKGQKTDAASAERRKREKSNDE